MSAPWVWDASAVYYAAKADRLDVFFDLVKSVQAAPVRSVTTEWIAQELSNHGLWSACAPYLDVVDLSTLQELQALARWLNLVSNGVHSRGEATAFAWAECHHGVVVIDDRGARKVAAKHGLTVHGTLWVFVEAVRAGSISAASAETLIEVFRVAGARYPFPTGGFVAWACGNGLQLT